MSGQHRRPRRYARLIGYLMIASGLVLAGRIAFFFARSSVVGGSMITKVEKASSPKKWPSGVLALIRVPSIGLTAPVEQGTGSSVLSVAVGHLTASVDPGSNGTSVLAGHDVSWFSGLGKVKAGDSIIVYSPGTESVFRVDSTKVVTVGTPVANTPNPSVVLETCWPLNALHLTPYRLLVKANLFYTRHLSQVVTNPVSQTYQATGIPAVLAKDNLTLSGNYLPMGKMSLSGSPSASWSESSSPYSFASQEVSWLIALMKAADSHSAALIADTAHLGESEVGSLTSGISGFVTRVHLTEKVIGTTAVSGKAQIEVVNGAGQQVEITEVFKVSGTSVSLASTLIQPVSN